MKILVIIAVLMMPMFVDCQKFEWDDEILIDAVYRQADDSTWTPKAISEA